MPAAYSICRHSCVIAYTSSAAGKPIVEQMLPHAHPGDADDRPAGDGFALPDLPMLPLARPGELSLRTSAETLDDAGRAPSAPTPPLIRPGASFTAADDRRAFTRDGEEQFTRELAARLAAGMLANPGQADASVKDAMALFHRLLQEMRLYSRVAAGLEGDGDEQRHRDAHGDWFRYEKGQKPEPSTPTSTPTPSPSPSAQPAQGQTPQPAPQPTPQPAPQPTAQPEPSRPSPSLPRPEVGPNLPFNPSRTDAA
jgi:cell division septation protein DedD